VRCLNSQSLDTFSSVPGRFQTIMQTSDAKVIINPDSEQVVSGGDGIWLMAQKRLLHIQWP
jgi:hypothetical protein